MTTKSPAFQFYPHDFVGGRVATYSLEEIGAYSLLLAYDWTLNGLPTEVEKLAKLCRVSARKFRGLWVTIGEQFPERDGRRFNPRLELERVKQADRREQMTHAAQCRWNAQAYADALPVESSPSPSPSTTKRKKTASATPDEQRVLDAYLAAHPRRRVGPKDVTVVRKALALGYAPDELAEAIAGNAADPWHRERNKHELSYVLRDAGHIDGFRVNAEPVQPIVDEQGVLTAYGARLTDPSRA